MALKLENQSRKEHGERLLQKQPQDWEQGERPIVWASRHFLMEQTGFSLATLNRRFLPLQTDGKHIASR
ncbi:MAG: helix-turn-helix domain-containing protein [Paracoccaceae bacterium]